MEVRITRAETVAGPKSAWGGTGGGSLRGVIGGGLSGSYAEYEFGIFAGGGGAAASAPPRPCLHTIRGRYSSLRRAYARLPASVPRCAAKFPDKRLVQDGVFQERRTPDDVGRRAQALRGFFAELLLENEASEAANLRLHRQMGVPEAASRLLCAALAQNSRDRAAAKFPELVLRGGCPALHALLLDAGLEAHAPNFEAGLDEGILSLCLPILVCMRNPSRYSKCK
jgi:hypothetical protein